VIFFYISSLLVYADNFEGLCKKNKLFCVDQVLRGLAKQDDAKFGVNKLLYPTCDSKEAILDCAKQARRSANVHLERCEDLISKLKEVKDYRIKDRLTVLVSSSLTTVLIPEPRTKFLTVGLALLTDLVVNEGFEKVEICYDLYKELSYAAICLEEFNYYNRLSLKAITGDECGFGSNYHYEFAMHAIDCLTRADMLTVALEYKLHGAIVSNHISELREALLNDMIRKRQLSSSYQSQMECCLENFDEIVADCSKKDRPLVKKIQEKLEDALICIKNADVWAP
jgi:hypothetical protein